jgi:hypothetical protein
MSDIKNQGDYAEHIVYSYLKKYHPVRYSDSPYDPEKDMSYYEDGLWKPCEVKGSAIFVSKNSVALEYKHLHKLTHCATNGSVFVVTPEVPGYPHSMSGKILKLKRDFEWTRQQYHGKDRLLIPIESCDYVAQLFPEELKTFNDLYYNTSGRQISVKKEDVTMRKVNGFEIVSDYVPNHSSRSAVYPWQHLKIGESFFVPKGHRKIAPTINSTAKRYGSWKTTMDFHRGVEGWFITKTG